MTLEKLKQIADARTPGDWEFSQEFGVRTSVLNSANEPTLIASDCHIPDGKFIVVADATYDQLLNAAAVLKRIRNHIKKSHAKLLQVDDEWILEEAVAALDDLEDLRDLERKNENVRQS